MTYLSRMNYKTLLMALALTGMAHVAHAGMVDEENSANPNSTAKANATQAAANKATECQKAVEEVNEALEKGQDERAKRLKQKKDAICSQQFSAAEADEKKVVNEINQAKADEPIPTVELTQAQKDAYKQYSDSMTKYEMKNLAGRPGLEQIPTKVAPGFAYPDDAKAAGYGMSGGDGGDFGARESPCAGCSSFHKGQDYSLRDATGTMDKSKEIASSAQGTVTFAGQKSGYGNVVEVDHGRYKTLYAHLDSIDVKTGDKVAYGQVVGVGGSSGVGTAAHLHYGVNDETNSANGGWVDPTRFEVTSLGNNKNYTTQEGGANSNPFQIISNNSGNYGNTGGGSTGSSNNAGSSFLSSNSGSATGGLGSTLSNLLGGNGSGANNPMSQILSQLFGGGGSSGSDDASSDGYGSSGNGYGSSSGTAASELVVKTVTEVAANGDTTRTTTYADGRTDSLTIKATGNTDAQLSALLVSMLGEEKAASTLASIKALCGTNLSTSTDADMLKVTKCQTGSAV